MKYANGVKATTLTTGTGDVTLAAVFGYVPFPQAFSVGDRVPYAIRNGQNWEWGIGTVQAGGVLERTTVASTLVAGVFTDVAPARITLTGVSEVVCAITAEDYRALNDSLLHHTTDVANPHGVTAAQANADEAGTAAGLVAAHAAALDPHNVYPLEADLGTGAFLDAGTAVGDLVQVQAGGALPALDASALLNLPASGVTDHGALTGLADDDHSQYHTDARGDARYATIAKGVTNGDSHNHDGGDGAQIAYASLSGLPTLGSAAAAATGAFEPSGAVSTHNAVATAHGISAWGATLVDDADANTARSTLGLGTAATTASTAYATSTQGANADSHASNTSNPHAVSKTQVGLGSVDNTSDASKPVSTAQQTALNLKANLASPTFTGTVGGITAAMVGAPSGSGNSTGTNTGDSATPAETTTTIGALLNGATSKTTPVDADQIGLMDSAASNVWKKLSWANLKTALSGIFVLLAGKNGGQSVIGGTGGTDGLDLQATSGAGTTSKVRVWVGSGGATEALTAFPSGAVGIKGAAESGALNVNGWVSCYTSPGYPSYNATAYSDLGWQGPRIGFSRTRGTLTGQTAVAAGDYLGWFDYFGHDGGAQQRAAQFRVIAESPISAGIMPSRFEFLTADTAGVTAIRFAIGNGGHISCCQAGGGLTVGSGSNSAKIHAISTTEQLRLGYDAANYLRATVNASGDATFGTAATASALTILANGNVGIGTTNPSRKSTVWGGQLISSTGQGASIFVDGLRVERFSGVGQYSTFNHFNGAMQFTSTIEGGGAYGSIIFNSSNNGTAVIERMRIDGAGRLGLGTASASAHLHAVSTTEQLRLGYDASNYLGSTTNSAGVTTFNLVGTAPAAKWAVSDATADSIYDVATFSKNSTGAGAAGLGARIVFAAKSSTTVDTPQAGISSEWVNATHATRTSRLKLSANDYGGARDGIIIESDGAVPRLGFYGATAVVKPTALTATVSAAPAGGTGTADGGWDTSINRDLAIATINNLKTRVDQLETKLQALGLLT